VVHLACKNPGATGADAVVANTWTNFSGSAGATAWDGQTKLYFYRTNWPGIDAALNISSLLSDTNSNGQCGAWEELFRNALYVNGISGSPSALPRCVKETILPPDGEDYLVVNNWDLGVADTNNPSHPWVLELNKNAAGNPQMVPSTNLSGTISNGIGIAGQNSPTPAEKIFSGHLVSRYTPIFGPDQYFDPSYGKVYTDKTDFLDQSGFGFARKDQTFTNDQRIKLLVGTNFSK
jgi:hypothetical protein